LPLAYSFGQLLNAMALWIFFSRDFKQFSQRVFQMFLENLIGALVLGIVSVGLLNIFDDVFDLTTTFGVLAQGFFAGIGGIAATVTTLYGLGSRELTEIWRAVRRKLSWRNPPVADELRI
jgi:hypothetical protein